jgi:hypothetical protein
MNYLKKNLIIYFCIISGLCDAQTYIGKNKLGKLEFLNDSICLLSFIRTDIVTLVSKCFYIKSQDTIYLTTKVPEHFKINISEKESPTGYAVLIKDYWYIEHKYRLANEGYLGVWDTIQQKLIIRKDFDIKKGEIIVMQNGPFSERLKINSDIPFDVKFISITDNSIGNDFEDCLYFKKFPLLVKGNKLIPCGDKNLLEDCWVNNGFYFPIMKKSKKDADFETIAHWSIGLRGLCNCFNIE